MELIILFVSTAGGGIISFHISRYYHDKSNLEAPEWAEEHLKNIIVSLPSEKPNNFEDEFKKALDNSNTAQIVTSK